MMFRKNIICNESDMNTIPAKCSIIATVTPLYGEFRDDLSILENVNLPDMINMFDLVLVMRDDHANDEEYAEVFLNDALPNHPPIANTLLKKYIHHARSINPMLIPESKKIMKERFLKWRSESNSAFWSNYTMIHVLRKLGEAHTRMHARDRVLPCDVDAVITLMEHSELGSDDLRKTDVKSEKRVHRVGSRT